MPLSEQALQNKKRYDQEYRKKNYKRIPLDVTPEYYEQIKRSAESAGESVNGYIKEAIRLRMGEGK